jgi:hypothetical protein
MYKTVAERCWLVAKGKNKTTKRVSIQRLETEKKET